VSFNNKTYNFMAAVSANLIYPVAYTWNGSQFVTQDQVLPAFGGLFMGAIRPVTLLFPSRNGVVMPVYSASEPVAGRSLLLRTEAFLEGELLGSVKLVANEKPAVFVDAFVPPPSPIGGLSVYAIKEGNQLWASQHAFSESVMQWQIRIVVPDAGNVSIKLNESENTTMTPYQYSVYDVAHARMLPVKDGQAMVYQAAGAADYVVKAVGPYAVANISTLAIYPNPFNPAAGQQVAIDYVTAGMSAPLSTKLNIYTIHGRKVYSQELTGKGLTDILYWNGRDDSGVLLPSDLYFFLLDLTDPAGINLKSKGKIVLWQ
jgi:hypothetical protein